LVVGAHPHVLQGIEARDGKLIAYSIGNFVFSARSEATRATGVLSVTIAPDGTVVDHAWHPARIDNAGRPIPLEGLDADVARDAFSAQPIEGTACT
jgi:poly-gamma-glutamate synthesis protein (capsule biosynthesis protein)